MSTVTTPNCACCGPQSGSGSGSGDGGSGSGSGDGPDDIPCGTCFGPGTPHPTDAEPLTVDATFLDLAETYPFVNDGNFDYQSWTAPAGFLNMSAHLCKVPGVGQPPAAHLILNAGGPNETVILTIENCRPFVGTGTSSLGPVVVTGNY